MAGKKLKTNKLGEKLKKDGTPAKPLGRKPNPNIPAKRPPTFFKGVERPHVWITGPDKSIHDKYHPWQMAKAQAAFRDEPWDLTFEEYCFLWKDHWEDRGRQPDNVCMTRKDDEGPWDKHNTEIVTRKEHFQRTSLKRMSNIGHRKRGPDTKPRRVTRITCPHCGLESTVSRIKTWHMDNCKHKGE